MVCGNPGAGASCFTVEKAVILCSSWAEGEQANASLEATTAFYAESKKKADALQPFENALTQLGESIDTKNDDASSVDSRDHQQQQRQPIGSANTQPFQIHNKNSSKKTFNEASHCIKVIRAEDKNRCGRPGGMEFDVFNTCNETVKFSLPTWKQNGKLNILSIGTVQPGRSTTMWGCDLQEKYGTSMSACFERNWLKTCNVLTNADYDSSGRLTY